MARPCAVIGTGQTDYRKKLDLTLDGLVRWAAIEALEDAGMTFADVDAIVIGKAPDALEGVVMPELSLADALGAVGKPIHRVHTAGSVGAATAITGTTMVESGRYDRVLVVCYEKQSEGNATWALSGGKSGGQGAGGTFAPWIRSYIERSGAPEDI
ncbi:MAG TPA: thiolase domain-containing protein, partial [Acidimicrobiales bacterium]